MIAFFLGFAQSLCVSLLYGFFGDEDKNDNNERVRFRNIFVPLFQFVWIVQLYYFVINYILKFELVKKIIKYVISNIEVIELLKQKNNIILNYYYQWERSILTLSILIFISAIFIEVVIRSFFEGNIRLILFSFEIVYFGKILFLSWLTYKLYTWSSLGYVLVIVLALIYSSRQEIIRNLKG